MQNDNSKFKREFKERLYKFVLRVLSFVNTAPKNAISNVIINQLIRSATSILANYVEASASSSKKEFINYFQYSLKSSNESVMWLSLLRDTNNGDKQEIAYLLKELDEIARIFASSILKLKGKK